MQYYIRKAKEEDIEGILKIINDPELESVVLKKSKEDIKNNNYFIAKIDNKIVGVVGYKLWENGNTKPEVISLVVDKNYQGRGVGFDLVKFCLEEIKSKGFKSVFTFTGVSRLFVKFGFKKVDVSRFSEKVLSDCANCPKNINGPTIMPCDEVAMELIF